jgi:hypothetical protein
MIYPDVTVEEWALKYDLDPTPDRCLRCRKLLDEWQPIATKEFRGLITKPHGCPEEYNHKVFVWANKSQRDGWCADFREESK